MPPILANHPVTFSEPVALLSFLNDTPQLQRSARFRPLDVEGRSEDNPPPFVRIAIDPDGSGLQGFLSVDGADQAVWEAYFGNDPDAPSRVAAFVTRSLNSRAAELAVETDEPADEAFCWLQTDIRRFCPGLLPDPPQPDSSNKRAKP